MFWMFTTDVLSLFLSSFHSSIHPYALAPSVFLRNPYWSIYDLYIYDLYIYDLYSTYSFIALLSSTPYYLIYSIFLPHMGLTELLDLWARPHILTHKFSKPSNLTSYITHTKPLVNRDMFLVSHKVTHTQTHTRAHTPTACSSNSYSHTLSHIHYSNFHTSV